MDAGPLARVQPHEVLLAAEARGKAKGNGEGNSKGGAALSSTELVWKR